jgi:hypothetical protein
MDGTSLEIFMCQPPCVYSRLHKHRKDKCHSAISIVSRSIPGDGTIDPMPKPFNMDQTLSRQLKLLGAKEPKSPAR